MQEQVEVQLAPNPKLRFFGKDGKPLAGGFLFVYEGESSQPVATWADAWMTTKNQVQIPLDANGEPSQDGIPVYVFLETYKTYKFRWFDSEGNLVGFSDDIRVLNRRRFYNLVVFDPELGKNVDVVVGSDREQILVYDF